MCLQVEFKKKKLNRRPADVPETFHHLVSGTSCNWVLQTFRGCPRLELLHICSSCKKQEQICNTKDYCLEKAAFSLNHQTFSWSPESLLMVCCRSRTLVPLGELQSTSPESLNSYGIIEKRWVYFSFPKFPNNWFV